MIGTLIQYLAQNTAVSVVAGGLVVLIAVLFRRKPGVVHMACVLALLALLMPRLWYMPVPAILRESQLAYSADDKGEAQHSDDRSTNVHSRELIEGSDPESAAQTNQNSDSKGGVLGAMRDEELSGDSIEPQASGVIQPVDGASSGLSDEVVGRQTGFRPGVPPIPWTLIVLAIWGAGSLACAASTIRRKSGFQRATRQAQPASRRLAELVQRCSREMRLAQVPAVLELDKVFSPLVHFAFSRPRLLMPTRLVSGLSDAELETLVRHELAHIKRGDHRVRFLELAATIVFWFNPVMWLIRNSLRRAEELACDSIVAGSAGVDRETCASAFLKSIDFLSLDREQGVLSMPIACTIGGVRFCKRRLRAMITGSHHATISMGQRFALAATTIPLFVFGFSATRLQQGTPRESPTADAGNLKTLSDADRTIASSPGLTPSEKPRVVSVFPADGAGNVDWETTIRIRFDQPMSFDKLILEWKNDRDNLTGFRMRGDVNYDAARFEFSIPVFLEPGKIHHLAINDDLGEETSVTYDPGFVSVNGIAAEGFAWSFGTAEASSASDGPAPKIVGVTPTSETEVALSTMLRVKFDQPMDPDWFGFAPREGYWRHDFSVSGDITYNPDTYEFLVPLTFPPNWNGDVTLAGFRSAAGVVAEPGTYWYRTRRKPISDEQIAAIEEAGRAVDLLQILEKIQRRYDSSKAFKVDVLWTSAWPWNEKLWAHELDVRRTTFARDREKYYGDVSVVMRSTKVFVIGSDGKKCWFQSNKNLTVVPEDQIDVQDVSIANPFNGISGRSIQQIVEEEKLEYLGVQTNGGKSFHQVRGWKNFQEFATIPGNEPVTWYFDTDTLLLSKVRHYGSEIVFLYHPFDVPLPESLFAPPDAEGLAIKEIEPLLDGYDKKFLRISDGSNGRISLRWGQTGPKGTASGGLN